MTGLSPGAEFDSSLRSQLDSFELLASQVSHQLLNEYSSLCKTFKSSGYELFALLSKEAQRTLALTLASFGRIAPYVTRLSQSQWHLGANELLQELGPTAFKSEWFFRAFVPFCSAAMAAKMTSAEALQAIRTTKENRQTRSKKQPGLSRSKAWIPADIHVASEALGLVIENPSGKPSKKRKITSQQPKDGLNSTSQEVDTTLQSPVLTRPMSPLLGQPAGIGPCATTTEAQSQYQPSRNQPQNASSEFQSQPLSRAKRRRLTPVRFLTNPVAVLTPRPSPSKDESNDASTVSVERCRRDVTALSEQSFAESQEDCDGSDADSDVDEDGFRLPEEGSYWHQDEAEHDARATKAEAKPMLFSDSKGPQGCVRAAQQSYGTGTLQQSFALDSNDDSLAACSSAIHEETSPTAAITDNVNAVSRTSQTFEKKTHETSEMSQGVVPQASEGKDTKNNETSSGEKRKVAEGSEARLVIGTDVERLECSFQNLPLQEARKKTRFTPHETTTNPLRDEVVVDLTNATEHSLAMKQCRGDVEGATDREKGQAEVTRSRPPELSATLESAIYQLGKGRWVSHEAVRLVLEIFTFGEHRHLEIVPPTEGNTWVDWARQHTYSHKPEAANILVPLLQPHHWTLLYLNIKDAKAVFCDSLPGDEDVEQVRVVAAAVVSSLGCDWEAESWQLVPVKTPKQTNSDDCGIHTLVTSLYLIANLSHPQQDYCDIYRVIFAQLLLEAPVNHVVQSVLDQLRPDQTQMEGEDFLEPVFKEAWSARKIVEYMSSNRKNIEEATRLIGQLSNKSKGAREATQIRYAQLQEGVRAREHQITAIRSFAIPCSNDKSVVENLQVGINEIIEEIECLSKREVVQRVQEKKVFTLWMILSMVMYSLKGMASKAEERLVIAEDQLRKLEEASQERLAVAEQQAQHIRMATQKYFSSIE